MIQFISLWINICDCTDLTTIQNMDDWLGGFRNGTVAREDIKIINSLLIDDNTGNGGNIHLPKEVNSDMYYTCVVHTERNDINTIILNNYINVTHPNGGSITDLIIVPKNTVIIESVNIDRRN